MRSDAGRSSSLSGGRAAQVVARAAAPRSTSSRAVASDAASAERVVYFPSCAARTMGAQRGDEETEALPVVAERLFAKAGFEVVYPERLGELCCGQPFESKGLFEAADRKSAELEAALRDASENGRLADRFRHESVHLPDAATASRASPGAGQHRVHPRLRSAAGRRRGRSTCRWPFTRCAACARWEPSTSSRRSRRAAAAMSCRSTRCCAAALRGTRASIDRNSTSTRCGT